VVPLGFGELTDALHKGERLPEVLEAEGPPDQAGVVEQLPARDLAQVPGGLLGGEGRDATAAGRADLLSERLGHGAALLRGASTS
jgi:hypothetical protein